MLSASSTVTAGTRRLKTPNGEAHAAPRPATQHAKDLLNTAVRKTQRTPVSSFVGRPRIYLESRTAPVLCNEAFEIMKPSLEPKGFLNSHARGHSANAQARSIVRVRKVNDERHFENL